MRHIAGLTRMKRPPMENSATPVAEFSNCSRNSTPSSGSASASVRFSFAMSADDEPAPGTRQGGCPALLSSACRLVGLLAQEGRDVVLVHPALLQRFHGRGAVAPD